MIAWFEWSHEPWPHDADPMMNVRWCAFLILGQIFTSITHPRSNLEFVLCVSTYVTAALIKCMEVLYIQNMKVLLYNRVYSTKIFIFPAGGKWTMHVHQFFLKKNQKKLIKMFYRFFLREVFYYIYTMTDPVPRWRAPQKSSSVPIRQVYWHFAHIRVQLGTSVVPGWFAVQNAPYSGRTCSAGGCAA